MSQRLPLRTLGIALSIIAAAVVLAVIMGRVRTSSAAEAAHFACMLNLRKLAEATLIYTENNNGFLMNRHRWLDQLEHPGPISHVTEGLSEQDEAASRRVETSVQRCPCLVQGGSGGPSIYGYAFYSPLSEAKLEITEHLINTPLFFESTNVARNASDPFLSFAGRASTGTALNPRKNIAYADGHVCGTVHVKLQTSRL